MYDMSIMASARRAFQDDKDRRDALLAQRTQEIYARLPRVEAIDRELRVTVGKLMIAAFESETDPQIALSALRDQNLALQRERAELLVGAGYPYDALDEVVKCKICSDSGTLSDGSPCRCLMAYYTKEQNRRLSKMLDLGSQSFDTFSLDWYDSEVRGEYGISPLKNMEIVLEICMGYAHTFGARSGNLLFTGAPGLGKTFLSACIARVVSENGHSVVYDTASHIFAQFEAEKFRHESEDDSEADVQRYLNCDLLIMDDLGTEMLTTFVQSAIYQLVNTRLSKGKKTIINTNLTPEEIGRRYGAAVQSRIEGEYELLPFLGEDIRKLKRQRG